MGVLCYTLIPRVMRILVSGKRTVLKFRHYEKAIKFEKNLPPILPKQLFLLSIVKKSGSCKAGLYAKRALVPSMK